MAYNKDYSVEAKGEVELWSRQNDVLQQLTAAEKLITMGELLQNPEYDMQYGSRRNLISVTYILQGCEGILLIISPNLKDKETTSAAEDYENEEPAPDGSGRSKPKGKKKRAGKGKDSETYEIYTEALNQVRVLINQSQAYSNNKILSNSKLTKAYKILKELTYCFKEETNKLGYDFKPKEQPGEAWMQ